MGDATTIPHCSATGCEREGATPCAYVDRHGDACPTQWCPAHVSHFAGIYYCRRHADTLAALTTPFDDLPPLPAVDNRAASLLHWMAVLLEEPVRELLDGRREPISEDLVSDYGDGDEDRRAAARVWTRRWRIIDHESGGAAITVTLSVSETADADIVLDVNGETVHRGKPPWISGRSKRKKDPVGDLRQRREYQEALLVEVSTALDAVRPPVTTT